MRRPRQDGTVADRQPALSGQHRRFRARRPPATRWRRWPAKRAARDGSPGRGRGVPHAADEAGRRGAGGGPGRRRRFGRRACRCGRTWTPSRTPTRRRFAACWCGRWCSRCCGKQTMRGLLAAGCDRFYEIGPGRVLAGCSNASAQGRLSERGGVNGCCGLSVLPSSCVASSIYTSLPRRACRMAVPDTGRTGHLARRACRLWYITRERRSCSRGRSPTSRRGPDRLGRSQPWLPLKNA